MIYELNIGLFIGSDHEHRLNSYAAVRTRFNMVAEVIHAELGEVIFHLGKEPTAVVKIGLVDWNEATRLAMYLCEMFSQDCIAVRNSLSGEGRLIGPRADAWGDFDLDYFVTWADA